MKGESRILCSCACERHWPFSCVLRFYFFFHSFLLLASYASYICFISRLVRCPPYAHFRVMFNDFPLFGIEGERTMVVDDGVHTRRGHWTIEDREYIYSYSHMSLQV